MSILLVYVWNFGNCNSCEFLEFGSVLSSFEFLVIVFKFDRCAFSFLLVCLKCVFDEIASSAMFRIVYVKDQS